MDAETQTVTIWNVGGISVRHELAMDGFGFNAALDLHTFSLLIFTHVKDSCAVSLLSVALNTGSTSLSCNLSSTPVSGPRTLMSGRLFFVESGSGDLVDVNSNSCRLTKHNASFGRVYLLDAAEAVGFIFVLHHEDIAGHLISRYDVASSNLTEFASLLSMESVAPMMSVTDVGDVFVLEGDTVVHYSSTGDVVDSMPAESGATHLFASSVSIPLVHKLSLASVDRGGGAVLTVEGEHFGVRDYSPSVIIDNARCAESAWTSDSSMECITPALPVSPNIVGVGVDVSGRLSEFHRVLEVAE